MPDRVTLSITNQLAHVRLNRADKRNALDLQMFKSIVSVQKQIARQRELRAVVLSGDGEDFCSGLDVRSMMGNRSSGLRLLWKWLPWQANLAQKVSVGWRRLQLPVIAAIQGRCWGGGLQIALGADFRIARPDASLSVMEGKWGLIPDMGGTLALRELMNRDQAMRLTMTADTVDGRQAHKLGLVTELSEDHNDSALALALRLTDRSPDAVAAVKRLYRKSWQGGRGMALARETLYQFRILTTANQGIAVRRQRGENISFRSARRW
jgi:enoyl-CoA hydratase/carnithine racemase